MSLTILAIVLLVGSFILSLTLTAFVRKLAVCAGFVSKPAAGRYNQAVIPLGGGVAILY